MGFEALYWLPFLAALRIQCGIARERIIPITRGGAGVWYDTPTAVELYAMRTPQDVRVEHRLQHQANGQLKQTHVTLFDRGVIQDAAASLGLTRRRDYHVLHPSWMYQSLSAFWNAWQGLGWLSNRLAFPRIAAPIVQGLTLPPIFAAARFYFRPTFKMTPTNVAFAEQTLRQMAAQHPVVVLNSGLHLDDHFDYVPTNIPNVTVLSDVVPLTPENNLAVQSAVLGRALGFVGTYGGLAQLALRMGKPSVSVYDDWQGTALSHRHLSDAVSLQSNVPFIVQRITDLALQQSVLPQVTVEKTERSS